MSGRRDYALSLAVLVGDVVFVWGLVAAVRWLWGRRPA